MITLFLATHLYWVINSSQMSECFSFLLPKAEACYVYNTQMIYVAENTTAPRDFVLFHELGHHLLRKVYSREMFVDEETLSDQFALFIFNQKYPSFEGPMLENRVEFFKQYCDDKCVDELVYYKVPKVIYPIQSFSVRY